jgi:hypothetical protein
MEATSSGVAVSATTRKTRRLASSVTVQATNEQRCRSAAANASNPSRTPTPSLVVEAFVLEPPADLGGR